MGTSAPHPDGAHPASGGAPVSAVSPLDVAVGAAALAVGSGVAAGRGAHAALAPVARGVLRALVPRPGARAAGRLGALARYGAERRVVLHHGFSRLTDVLVAAGVREVLRRGRLEELPRHVDLNRVVAAVDLDAVVDRLDLTGIVLERVDLDLLVAAVLDRLDLVGLSEGVIDAIDLPGIIRESTGSMASETMHDVRMQSIAADEAVGRVVDRLLARRGRRPGVLATSPAGTTRSP